MVWDIEILKEIKEGYIVQTMDGETHFITWKSLEIYNNARSIKGWNTIVDLHERQGKYHDETKAITS
jgi:hypothetical protein